MSSLVLLVLHTCYFEEENIGSIVEVTYNLIKFVIAMFVRLCCFLLIQGESC